MNIGDVFVLRKKGWGYVEVRSTGISYLLRMMLVGDRWITTTNETSWSR